MALLGFEGFDNLAAPPSNDLNLILMPFDQTSGNAWWSISNPGAGFLKTPGLLGGSSVTCSNTLPRIPFLSFDTSYKTIIVGVRALMLGAFVTPSNILLFNDGSTTQCGLSVNIDGKLFFWRGTTATVLATGTTTLIPGSWYFIEVKVTIDNSVGAFEVRLAGVSVELNVTGQDTQVTANDSINAIGFSLQGVTAGPQGIDDVYALDTTGPSPFNDFLGVIRVETLFPTSNVSVTWTPLAHTNWQEVSEVDMDRDTSYNSNTTTGIDTFGHTALSSTPVVIFGVSVVSAARKDDVMNLNYRNKLISGVTTADGARSNLATVYQYVRDYYAVNPDGPTDWTATTINACNIGYERY